MNKINPGIFPIILKIDNYFTPVKYTIFSGDSKRYFSEQDIRDIVRICNEPLIMHFLLKDKITGQQYTSEHAAHYIETAVQGWKLKTNYIFFIRNNKHRIVANIDVQVKDQELAELGYWASQKSPGIMTNAINTLLVFLTQNGFKRVVCQIKDFNARSINLVRRCNFNLIKTESIKTFQYLIFERDLTQLP